MTDHLPEPAATRGLPAHADDRFAGPRTLFGRLARPIDALPVDVRRNRRRWTALVLAIAAIALAALVLDRGSVGWAVGLPAWIHSFAGAITDTGQSQWPLVPTGVAALVLAAWNWRRIELRRRAAWAEIGALVTYVFCSVALALIASNVVKMLFGRSRPVGFAENGAFTFRPFSFSHDFGSFPSGHGATVGAVMVAVSLAAPRLRPLVVIYAVLIAVSRIVVGAHFPSDVIAGLLLGALAAVVTARFFARRRIGFEFRSGRLDRRLVAVRRVTKGRGLSGLFSTAATKR